MPARRMRKRETLRCTAAVLLASCLALAAVPPAQSGTAEGVAAATPAGLYPAPGQPSPEVNGDDDANTSVVTKEQGALRIATLHAGITADPQAEAPVESLVNSLATGNHSQARAVAQTAQLNDPDVLILTGVSYDEDQQIAEQLSGYLASGQHSAAGLEYPYVFTAPTNSGRESGVDLDGDGSIGGPGDAVGYGEYPGQYGTVIFSKYPIMEDEVRTFQQFLWSDVPESGMPQDTYSDLEASVLRLSETSLWDVPVEVEGQRISLLTTAVVSENGTEDTARGDDLRQAIADYVAGQAWYLYDDEGESAAGSSAAHYVVAGVPVAKTGPENLDVLLESPMLQDPQPEAVTERPLSGRPGSVWHTDQLATRYVPGDRDVRASYVLPSSTLQVDGSGVFWPGEGELGYQLVNPRGVYTLADRLVWVDLTVSG